MYVIELLLKKKNQQPPPSLFLMFEQLLANTVLSVVYHMYFIAIARLFHRSSRAGCIPAGDIKINWLIYIEKVWLNISA